MCWTCLFISYLKGKRQRFVKRHRQMFIGRRVNSIYSRSAILKHLWALQSCSVWQKVRRKQRGNIFHLFIVQLLISFNKKKHFPLFLTVLLQKSGTWVAKQSGWYTASVTFFTRFSAGHSHHPELFRGVCESLDSDQTGHLSWRSLHGEALQHRGEEQEELHLCQVLPQTHPLSCRKG